MAYPPLIQKIMSLAERVEDGHLGDVSLAREMLVMSNRLTGIEIALIENGMPSGGGSSLPGLERTMPPEGYVASGGARVAPVTITSEGSAKIPNAALTLITSEE